MNDLKPKRYVRINQKTDQVFEDDFFTDDEAVNINARLACSGEPDRWMPYAERDGDSVVAA